MDKKSETEPEWIPTNPYVQLATKCSKGTMDNVIEYSVCTTDPVISAPTIATLIKTAV